MGHLFFVIFLFTSTGFKKKWNPIVIPIGVDIGDYLTHPCMDSNGILNLTSDMSLVDIHGLGTFRFYIKYVLKR